MGFNSGFKGLSPVVILHTTAGLKFKKFEEIQEGFLWLLGTYSAHFPTHHSLIGFDSQEAMCLLGGTNSNCNCISCYLSRSPPDLNLPKLIKFNPLDLK